jgi:hypothetical protein
MKTDSVRREKARLNVLIAGDLNFQSEIANRILGLARTDIDYELTGNLDTALSKAENQNPPYDFVFSRLGLKRREDYFDREVNEGAALILGHYLPKRTKLVIVEDSWRDPLERFDTLPLEAVNEYLKHTTT